MKITQVSFGMTVTESLPEYRNVKPSITLTAEIGDGESAEHILEELRSRVRSQLENEVDRYCERLGIPPRFYDGPRYRMMNFSLINLPVLMPEKVWDDGMHKHDLPGNWQIYPDNRNRNYVFHDQRRELLLEWLGQEVLELDEDEDLVEWAWWIIRDYYVVLVVPVVKDRAWNQDEATAIVPAIVWRIVRGPGVRLAMDYASGLMDVQEKVEKAGRAVKIIETPQEFEEWKAQNANAKPADVAVNKEAFLRDDETDDGDGDDDEWDEDGDE